MDWHHVLILVLNTNLYHPGNCPGGIASCGEDALSNPSPNPNPNPNPDPNPNPNPDPNP